MKLVQRQTWTFVTPIRRFRFVFGCIALLICVLVLQSWIQPYAEFNQLAAIGLSPGNADSAKNPTANRRINSTDEVRVFRPYGSGAAMFVVYGAYRGGSDTFAVVGLGSKPLYTFGDPQFQCYWLPATATATYNENISDTSMMVRSKTAYRMLPDVNYGRVYTVVVVNCTFQAPVGTSPTVGGQLILLASASTASKAQEGDNDGVEDGAVDVHVERIVALTEDAGSYNASRYVAPYPYEFVYCGSPLFGRLSRQRLREWIAYHVWLFGPKSHFIFHDAGGLRRDAGVRAVLKPWEALGYVSVVDVTQEARYDGYYHNQFLIINDCLHRTRFMSNWTFFFDVDEYIFLAPGLSFRDAMASYSRLTMLQFNQYRMSDGLCQTAAAADDAGDGGHSSWGFEKLVYRDKVEDYVKTAPKYAIQGRNVFATGVHRSQKELGHMEGEEGWAWWAQLRYYHYHNTINQHDNICKNYTNSNITHININNVSYELDTSMVSKGKIVKQFEEDMLRKLNIR